MSAMVETSVRVSVEQEWPASHGEHAINPGAVTLGQLRQFVADADAAGFSNDDKAQLGMPTRYSRSIASLRLSRTTTVVEKMND
ncbi:hypothetical protein CH253_08360 [Rhodococcus sp. 06-156-3C]|uniref:hypothetical protein n=1 Tax=Rhodococcus sp. 06-156-3C TaxID=2022486 RepID=UPI000B9A653F|nr:hypothetical protein [Rhodococcus sp. 06-156-3C]OZD23859.1 hypothetical protein CH253_08360 [Rhodococcus sp. 06-156-3C]